MLGLAGVTAIDTRVAAVTVSEVDPETLPSVAEIVVEPPFAEVARPFEPPALLIVATAAVRDAAEHRLRAVSRRGRLARWFGEDGGERSPRRG